jgi:spermidine synthase
MPGFTPGGRLQAVRRHVTRVAVNFFKSWRGARRNGVSTHVQISEEDGIRYLHLGTDTVQSGMRVSAPDELVLAYTRSMMAFLLFVPPPERVVTVGLGGGSVSKWIHRHLPSSRQVVVELNQQVIDIARRYFCVPDDDERLAVVQGDGAQWLAAQTDVADLIIVDGYDGVAIVEELSTDAFYASCARALSRDGVLVVNLWGSDRKYSENLHRIEGAFGGQVVCVPALQKGNIIVMGFKRAPTRLRWDDLRDRARELETVYGLEFLRFVEVLKRLNPHTDKRLLI